MEGGGGGVVVVVVVVVVAVVGVSLLLLFVYVICWFVAMSWALLKFELSFRVVLSTDFFFYKKSGRFCSAFHRNLSFVIVMLSVLTFDAKYIIFACIAWTVLYLKKKKKKV